MKVTFIQPYYFNVWEALGIGYIASYCKENFREKLDLNFYQAKFDSDEEIIQGSKDSDIVAFSCTTPSFNHGLFLANEIKALNNENTIIFGGWHINGMSTNELKSIYDESCIDFFVKGEGENAFLRILNEYDKYWINTPIYEGDHLEFKDLPWPDRDLIKNERTIKLCQEMTGKRITSIQAHRGCPFTCKYCAEKNMTENCIRSRDIPDVLDELEYITEKYNLDMFKFADATFDITPKYVIDFCKEKINRDLKIEFECMIHANIATEEMFYWLKQANCNQINVGCESGSPKVLKEIRKGTTVEKIENVFKWARNYNINRRAFFIIGMPSETSEDIEMTKGLIRRIDPDCLGVTILCPYPGCDLYDSNKFEDIDWAKTDEYSNDFWSTEHFTNDQLKKIQKEITEEFKSKLVWHQKQI